MEDFHGGSADSNTEHGPVSKEPKSANSAGCSDVAAALNSGMYAEKLLEMRKAIGKHGGSYNEADEAVRLKFLLNWSLKPEKAAKMFVQFQKWRASYLPLGYIPDSEVSSLLDTEVVTMLGKSKKGWPVLLALACKSERTHDYEAVRRFLVYIMEKATAGGALLGRMIVILDMDRVSLKNFDLKNMVLGFQLEEKYYPGILGKLYIVNSSKLINIAYKLIAPLLPKAAKEKIAILESLEMTDVLLSEMDAEVLPTMYGGRGEIVLLQDFQVPNWGPPAE